MLVQPYLENAFKHGLLHQTGRRELRVAYGSLPDSLLQVTVEDTGVGRRRAARIQQEAREIGHRSFATSATAARLRLLNENDNERIGVKFSDLVDASGQASGTRVTITIKLLCG